MSSAFDATGGESAARPRDGKVRTDLLWLFGVIYVVEACCEPRGVIGQPLMRYAKDVLAWSPVRISVLLSLFSLPWMFKPAYGLLCDLVPIFGFRRKSYLIGANVVALAAYLLIAATTVGSMPVLPLMAVFIAMAISSTVAGGLLVESGQRSASSDLLVNQQWLWLSIASVPVLSIGGWLAQQFRSNEGIRLASLFLCAGPLLVAVVAVLVVREQRRKPLQSTVLAYDFRILKQFLSTRLLTAAAFLFFYMFSPGFYVALYFHMTDHLHFSQGFIGVLGSVGAAGSVVGALAHRYWLRRLPMQVMVYVVLIAGVGSALTYLLLLDPVSAVLINFISGVIGTLTIIVAATLMADFCPPGAEAFGYAILATVENLAIRLSDLSGAYLYHSVFHNQLVPLVLISAAATAFPILLIPLLRLTNNRQGEPVFVPDPLPSDEPG